jgi:Zn finger protein HypA/HybF involved in hydrogenase expression
MRQLVKCLNCGIKWVRVVPFGAVSESNDDLMYNCPNCNSNHFKPIEEE